MVLIGFLQAQNCSTLPSSWRHRNAPSDFLSPEYYRRIGRILEKGCFHLGFFDDRLAMPDRYGNDPAIAVEHGIRSVKLDPSAVLMAMGMATERLGLGATYSTTYYEPFHVARLFATMDHLTGGRVAWNIVTSLNESEAKNMGRGGVLEHDARYDRADEFLDVVDGLWRSWEDDALVVDRETGRFAHPDKVHRLNYAGSQFTCQGPLTVPRTPQGHPVLIQAGSSGRGRQFAARWAELIFTSYENMNVSREAYAGFKEELARAGRDPSGVRVANAIYTVAAATRAEAEDKMAEIEKHTKDIDTLALMSEVLDFDFSKRGLDDPLNDEDFASIAGSRSLRDRVVRGAGTPNPTVRDFMKYSGRGRPHIPFVGGPKEIADGLEEWFSTGACDGFVLGATHVPGTYEDFVTHVVPELQKRGLFHKEYKGATLRENLDLPIPRNTR
jgi:FMN-dependent oxidoreductase (nitrilotriacetate monooxygenase family)